MFQTTNQIWKSTSTGYSLGYLGTLGTSFLHRHLRPPARSFCSLQFAHAATGQLVLLIGFPWGKDTEGMWKIHSFGKGIYKSIQKLAFPHQLTAGYPIWIHFWVSLQGVEPSIMFFFHIWSGTTNGLGSPKNTPGRPRTATPASSLFFQQDTTHYYKLLTKQRLEIRTVIINDHSCSF